MSSVVPSAEPDLTMVLISLLFVPCAVVAITIGLPVMLFLITVAAMAIFWYEGVINALSSLRNTMMATLIKTEATSIEAEPVGFSRKISFQNPELATKLRQPAVKSATWTTSHALATQSCVSRGRDHDFEFTPRRRVRFG